MEGENSWETKSKMKIVIPCRGGLVGLCKTYDGMLRGRAKVEEISGGSIGVDWGGTRVGK